MDLESYLKKTPTTNSQRAELWDAFEGSPDEDVFADKIKDLKVSALVKARLWDMKAGVNVEALAAAPEPPKSALRRFAGGVVDSLNPLNIAEGLGAAAGRGLAAIDREGLGGALASGGRAMVDAQSRGLVNAWDLAGEGRTTEALGQAVSGVLPIVGPMARGLGEEAAETGDLAGALGHGVGMAVAPRAASKVPPAVRFVDGRVVQPLRKVGGKVLRSDLAKTALEMAKDNAPAAVGGAIGGAVAGPWGAAAGATAGKVLQESWKSSSKKVRDAAKKPLDSAVKKSDEGALFDAKTGQPVKMTPEQAKAAVDDLPWNKSKASKTPAQATFDKARGEALMKQVDEAVSPNAAFEILKKHGVEGKKIPTADARAIVDAVWTKKDSTYKNIEQWMADRSEKWNTMRHSSRKKGN